MADFMLDHAFPWAFNHFSQEGKNFFRQHTVDSVHHQGVAIPHSDYLNCLRVNLTPDFVE